MNQPPTEGPVTGIELYTALRETISTELQLAISYLDKVDPSEIIEDARLAFAHVMALANAGGPGARPPAAAIPSLLEHLVQECTHALAPVLTQLKPLPGFGMLKTRVCILKVLDECAEVRNELGRTYG